MWLAASTDGEKRFKRTRGTYYVLCGEAHRALRNLSRISDANYGAQDISYETSRRRGRCRYG